MRFVDEAVITVRSGKGGHGCVSFRREKFIPKGGPDGGDGGGGGNVVLRASSRLHSLYDFRLKRLYEAQNGQPGRGSQCHGKGGLDMVIDLPVGTQVYRLAGGERGELLCDLPEDGAEYLIAKGGMGGKGNEFFKSPTMRAPRFAQPGEPGEEITLGLELKILADCGLLGLPNAGKSTFITQISAARPKVANYPFTTLEPNLGVMLDDGNYDRRMVIADIPGLIEGAHEGLGLGHRFLRHVERTRFLVHLLSVEDILPEDPWAGYGLINNELARFDPDLAQRRQLLAVNKIDLAEPELLDNLKQRAAEDGLDVFFISAKEGMGIEELVAAMWQLQDSLGNNAPVETFTGRIPRDLQAKMDAEAAADTGEAGSAEDDDDDFSGITVTYTRG